MAFDSAFDHRWNNVIAPAISSVIYAGNALTAHRIDLSNRGDSILTEILDEIATCAIVIADISTVTKADARPIRNANVFYEFGLAHAVRLPEEVLLIRSEEDNLPFDVSNVRVHRYSPDDDAPAAQQKISQLITDALESVDQLRTTTVRRVAETLDFECFDVLWDIGVDGSTGHPSRQEIVSKQIGLFQASARIAAIQRLLELGAISTQFQRITAEHIGGDSPVARQDLARYTFTRFGRKLLKFILAEMNYFTPEVQEMFAQRSDPA